MATVNFSVPEDVKADFDRVFRNQNKSAIIAELMHQAVAEAKHRGRRPSMSDREIRAARVAGRP